MNHTRRTIVRTPETRAINGRYSGGTIGDAETISATANSDRITFTHTILLTKTLFMSDSFLVGYIPTDLSKISSKYFHATENDIISTTMSTMTMNNINVDIAHLGFL